MIKADMVFEFKPKAAGWVETWYLDVSSLDSALDKIVNIAQKRITFCPTGVDIPYVRVSANTPFLTPPPHTPKRTRNMRLSAIGLVGNYGTGGNRSDTRWQAIPIRWQGVTSGVFKSQNMRGVTDFVWDNGRQANLKNIYKSFLDGYLTVLQANNAVIRHVSRPGPAESAVALSRYDILRVSHRDTGRPLYLQRGRRSKRR